MPSISVSSKQRLHFGIMLIRPLLHTTLGLCYLFETYCICSVRLQRYAIRACLFRILELATAISTRRPHAEKGRKRKLQVQQDSE
jgi:hypothetical protein